MYAFRDVTDERAVEQLKTDFVSTVSHELRTPLAAIYGAAMTLRRRDVAVDEAQRDRLLEVDLERIRPSRADRQRHPLGEPARVGRMSIAIERCDAAAIADRGGGRPALARPGGLELVVTQPRGLPQVAADSDKLRQVLTNLDRQRGQVLARRRTRRGRDRRAAEVVCASASPTTGLGIPPAEQDRIFEKFFRLDPNLTRGVGGTGLGLYITRELVLRMNGRIWVDSDGRTGSSFFLELPVA